jgi:hypothetical protein
MTIKTAATVLLRWARRCLGAVRSLSPAAITITVALIVGGAGFADAATGGNFILGTANHEEATASLTDSKGTPLSLSAPANVAPLAVNGKAMVANLNANYLGGLSASDMQSTGGDGFTSVDNVTPLSNSPTVVATTGPLAAGTYYVTATALVTPGSASCYVAKGSSPQEQLSFSTGSPDVPVVQDAATVAVSLAVRDTLQELCYGAQASAEYSAITAIRILSSSGTTPTTTGPRTLLDQPKRHGE